MPVSQTSQRSTRDVCVDVCGGMEIPLVLHKFCQIGARKLLVIILVTAVASLVLVVQFLSTSCGTPSIIAVIGNGARCADSFPKSQVILGITSISSNISVRSSEMKNTEFDLVGNPNETQGKKGNLHDNFGLNEDLELKNEEIFDRSVSSQSISQGVTKPGHGFQSEEVSVNNFEEEGKLLNLEADQSNVTTLSKDKRSEITDSTDDLTMMTNTLQNNDLPGQATSNVPVEMARKSSTSIVSDMHLLLIKSRSSSCSMIPKWPSERDQEILSARSLIENAPKLKKDKQLHESVFHNVSMFKRSYELMEKTLKVYVYKEGAQPIFHTPDTKGIYASEGWFMKLMEENHHFTVTDPRRAHLFYFPFSPRRLQQSLYVANSHSRGNLIAYLKSYLDLILTKYPYWNRTMGADHFLVGCHDWTPRETKKYMGNCIRVMCAADISRDFAMGKDVSLPQTNVRSAKDPVRDLGGKPASKRTVLAFFAGSTEHGNVRAILQKYWGNKDPGIEIHGHMGRSGEERTTYVEYMKKSKYCICAKGYEVNTPRVVEAIFYECVPVIISDNFVPPFLEVLNWESFAVFVAEKDIRDLKNILRSISEEKYVKLQMRVKQVQQHFLWHTKPVKYDIFHMILHSIWYNRVFQIKVA